jgi:hypothetical protein
MIGPVQRPGQCRQGYESEQESANFHEPELPPPIN